MRGKPHGNRGLFAKGTSFFSRAVSILIMTGKEGKTNISRGREKGKKKAWSGYQGLPMVTAGKKRKVKRALATTKFSLHYEGKRNHSGLRK